MGTGAISVFFTLMCGVLDTWPGDGGGESRVKAARCASYLLLTHTHTLSLSLPPPLSLSPPLFYVPLFPDVRHRSVPAGQLGRQLDANPRLHRRIAAGRNYPSGSW
jgi:hypothetical protein